MFANKLVFKIYQTGDLWTDSLLKFPKIYGDLRKKIVPLVDNL